MLRRVRSTSARRIVGPYAPDRSCRSTQNRISNSNSPALVRLIANLMSSRGVAVVPRRTLCTTLQYIHGAERRAYAWTGTDHGSGPAASRQEPAVDKPAASYEALRRRIQGLPAGMCRSRAAGEAGVCPVHVMYELQRSTNIPQSDLPAAAESSVPESRVCEFPASEVVVARVHACAGGVTSGAGRARSSRLWIRLPR
jgi:hypothetical protein